MITTGGSGAPPAPHSIIALQAYARDLVGAELIQSWLFDLMDLLELHEEACKPVWADAKVGALDWVRFHEAMRLPGNFVVVGDALMKLNPIYGMCDPSHGGANRR